MNFCIFAKEKINGGKGDAEKYMFSRGRLVLRDMLLTRAEVNASAR